MTEGTMQRNGSFSFSPLMAAVIMMGGFFVLIIILAASCGLYANSLDNHGVNLETQLTAQYKTNQTELSGYVSGFYEKFGILQANTQALDTVLTDAVKGRYDTGAGSAQVDNGKFFSAVREAYPNLDQFQKNFSDMQDYISAGRAKYANTQNKLIGMLQNYDSWRKTGNPMKKMILKIGIIASFPSDALVADGKGFHFTGMAAHDKMYELVLDSTTQKAYESGTLDPLSIPTMSVPKR